jgi:hypothetical protein
MARNKAWLEPGGSAPLNLSCGPVLRFQDSNHIVLCGIPWIALMSRCQHRRHYSSFLRAVSVGGKIGDGRATVGAKPWRRRSTSSYSRVLCLSECSSGAFPVFVRASILRSASKQSAGIPHTVACAPAVARVVFAGPLPRRRLPVDRGVATSRYPRLSRLLHASG